MAYAFDLNTGTDTAISGVSTLTLTRGLPNFGADWRIQEGGSLDELTLVNLNSPVAYPEMIHFKVEQIKNVYQSRGISNTLQYPDTRGVRVVIRHSGIGTVTDSVDTTYLCAVPWSITSTITIGNHPAVTASNIHSILARHVSDFFETGSATTDRIASLIRGALKPTDV
jgi:hypothetical protein